MRGDPHVVTGKMVCTESVPDDLGMFVAVACLSGSQMQDVSMSIQTEYGRPLVIKTRIRSSWKYLPLGMVDLRKHISPTLVLLYSSRKRHCSYTSLLRENRQLCLNRKVMACLGQTSRISCRL